MQSVKKVVCVLSGWGRAVYGRKRGNVIFAILCCGFFNVTYN